jgi:hypothetical protein
MSTNPRDVVDQLSPEVLAIHQWIRDDAPVTIQMTITPKLISALVERLNAARPAIVSALQPAVSAEAVEAAFYAYLAAQKLAPRREAIRAALTAALPFMMGERT